MKQGKPSSIQPWMPSCSHRQPTLTSWHGHYRTHWLTFPSACLSFYHLCCLWRVRSFEMSSLCPQQPACLSFAACTLPWPGQIPTPRPPRIPLIMTLLPPLSRLHHLPLSTIPLSAHRFSSASCPSLSSSFVFVSSSVPSATLRQFTWTFVALTAELACFSAVSPNALVTITFPFPPGFALWPLFPVTGFGVSSASPGPV